jgi:transcriptional regulator with XRE-family HTH domain
MGAIIRVTRPARRHSEDHTMERPGEKLRHARERLKLTYRDVAEASQEIAQRRGSDDFSVALSRLADIENKGTLPTIYRLYTLCAIYRLDWKEVLRWYGVPLDLMASEALQIHLDETHAIHFPPESPVTVPQPLNQEIDLDKTTFLSHMIRRWGKLPLNFLNGLEHRHLRYGFIGFTDWSMYPILAPGSLVLIDQNRQKIAVDGWSNELERPIYFLEHRDGYRVGWCTPLGERLLLQPHPGSQTPATLFEYGDVDVVGQVTGLAMLLESRKRRHGRTSAIPAKSPNP